MKYGMTTNTKTPLIVKSGYWDWNIEKKALWWSEDVYRIFDVSTQEFDGTYESFLRFVHPEDKEFVKNAIHGALQQKKPYHIEHRIVMPDNSEKIIHAQAEVFFNKTGIPVRMFGTMQDITESINAEVELKLADIVFKNTLDGVLVTNKDTVILSVNPSFTRITGYNASETIGQTPRILKSHRHDVEFYKDMWSSLLQKGQWQGEIWNRRKNGEVFLEWLSILASKNERGKPDTFVAVFKDITEVREKEEYIKHLAYHDALTNLPNRLLFHDRLQQTLTSARRHANIIAVIFIDLDRFKHINDTLGHNVGDALLQEVASRLKGSVRREDTVSRLGGDEFVVLLPDIKEVDDAALVAKKILSVLSKPYTLYGHELIVTASLGISAYPGDGDDVEILMKNADTAMYHAKEHGKNTYHFFEANMTGE